MGIPARVAGAIANVLDGTGTCDIVLTNRCGGSIAKIWLMCSGKDVGSDTMMDLGPLV